MTITLKNVPRSLHQALKRQAKEHKRSLNQELIQYLEEKTEAAERRKKAVNELIRYRNELDGHGTKVRRRLDPVRIIRDLRDGK